MVPVPSRVPTPVDLAVRRAPGGRTVSHLAFPDDDAALTGDAGTVAVRAARHFDIRRERRFHLSANLASMAPGLPYAIAAQLAHPGPALVDARVDPDEPVLLPRVAPELREKFEEAFREGQPGRAAFTAALEHQRAEEARA